MPASRPATRLALVEPLIAGSNAAGGLFDFGGPTGAKPVSPLFPKPDAPYVGMSPMLLPATLGPGSDSPHEELSSNMQTAFNIVNNYVGMVLLSMSYCFVTAGWLALPLLALLTAFGAYTGALIVASYEAVRDSGETIPSYANIGERACGAGAKWLVIISSVVENLFALVSMNVITWKNAALLLPMLPLRIVIALCVLLSFPTNYLRNFSVLSFLSAFGVLCVIFICVVIGYSLLEDSAATGVDRKSYDVLGVPMSASIMLAGLTGHVGLPPMYASMRTPAAFYSTLGASFTFMFFLYGFIGAAGYYLYGAGGHVLITVDMSLAATSALEQVLVSVVLAGITFKLFASCPMCVVVLTDIVENLHLERTGDALTETIVLRWRLAIWFVALLFSFVTFDSLQYLTAFIGVNSLIISIILPVLFYMLLHRSDKLKLGLLSVLLLLSAAVSVMITCVDVRDFVASLHGSAAAR